MPARKKTHKLPLSFMFFAISLSLWLIFWTGLYIVVANSTPNLIYVGILSLTVAFLASVLCIIGTIVGLRYNSDLRSNRLFNRVGIIGNILMF